MLLSFSTSVYQFLNAFLHKCLAINCTPHFGVWSALAPALKFRGVWITAPALTPALHQLLQKPNFCKKELRKKFFYKFFINYWSKELCG